MFPPSISGPVGVHPPGARSTDHQLVRRRCVAGELPINSRGAQFAAAVRKFSVALPKIGTPNSLAPVQYRTRSFVRTAHSFFRRNNLATMTNDETRQRSASFDNERRSQVHRQKGPIGNRPLAQHACASSLQRFNASALQPRAGFTLLELLIVVGIIGLLLVLIAPAFTTIKSAGDVTSAAYTIKGVLDTARTYAKANNSYNWLGRSGSIGK